MTGCWQIDSTINVVKINSILFSSGQKRVSLDLFNSGLNIELNGTPINRKDHTKFLGVYIDQNLNWNVHIKHISRKIAIFTFILLHCFLGN